MAFHNKQEETPSNEIKAGFTFLNFGTNCLKLVSPKHGSGGISPVAAYRSKQPEKMVTDILPLEDVDAAMNIRKTNHHNIKTILIP